MSFTEFDSRLQGAKRAEVVPTIGGSRVLALLIASPETGHVVLADLLGRLAASPSIQFPQLSPRSLAVDTAREQVWVYCDTGWLIRCQFAVANGQASITEMTRSKVSAGGFGQWAIFAQGPSETGRRIAAGRAVQAAPRLGGTSASLVETVASGTSRSRIIDVRSHRCVIVPIAPGVIAAYATVSDGIVLASRLNSLVDVLEAGAFDPDTGYLYVFGSGGDAAIVELLPNDQLRLAARITLPNVEGPVSAQIIDGKLYVGCERRNRMTVWDLSDPEAPVLFSDETFDTGSYWSRNPVRFVRNDDLTVVRKFGSIPEFLDHGDFPIEEAGAVVYDDNTMFSWALNGEVAALTYTLFIEPAVNANPYFSSNDAGGVWARPAVPPDEGRYTTQIGGATPGGDFVALYTFPGVKGVRYRTRMRIRGRTESKRVDNTNGASALTTLGAVEIAAGYKQVPQVSTKANTRWGTWVAQAGPVDVATLTIGAPGDDVYSVHYIAVDETYDLTLPAYHRAEKACRIDTLLELDVLGGQQIAVRIYYGGDSSTRVPCKHYADGLTSDINVNPNNAELMPPDDDPAYPLAIPWFPRVTTTLLNQHRYHFLQVDITHIQQAPGY